MGCRTGVAGKSRGWGQTLYPGSWQVGPGSQEALRSKSQHGSFLVCVTLGQWLQCSVPQSLLLGSGHNSCSHFVGLTVQYTLRLAPCLSPQHRGLLAQPPASTRDTTARRGKPGDPGLRLARHFGGDFLLPGLSLPEVFPGVLTFLPSPPPLSLLFTLLQPHRPPRCSPQTSGMVLPQDLCMYCVLHLRSSYRGVSSFRSLFKCPLL